MFCLAKRDLWETLGDYPEARASLTERGCQLLRKDGLLDEELFASKFSPKYTTESNSGISAKVRNKTNRDFCPFRKIIPSFVYGSKTFKLFFTNSSFHATDKKEIKSP